MELEVPVELSGSGMEYPGIMAKVDILEHRVEVVRPFGEYCTKHFGMSVGISGLPTCIQYFNIVSLMLFDRLHV